MAKQNATAEDLNLTPEEEKALAAEFESDKYQGITADLRVHRPEINGKPNPIVGVLVGKRVVNFKDDKAPEGVRPTNFYIISTTLPTILLDKDKKPYKAKAGTYALVCERYDLRALARFMPVSVPDKNGVIGVANYTKVAIKPLEKLALPGTSRTIWKFEVKGMHCGPEDVKVPALLAPATQDAPIPERLLAAAREEGSGTQNEDSPEF